MTAQTVLAIVAGRVERKGTELLASRDAAWSKAAECRIPLEPTPLDQIPSAYVQRAWRERAHGQVAEVAVRALASTDALMLRLQWRAEQPQSSISDYNVYADACAVLFPLDGKGAELNTMGSDDRPVAAWHWRAGTDRPFVVTARGLGTVSREPEGNVLGSAEWAAGSWTVVLGRSLAAAGVPLAHGSRVPVGFAVWLGVAGERAGLKAHSPAWHELQVG